MRYLSILIFFVILFFAGCVSPPDAPPTTEQGDIEIISFKLLNESIIKLGDSFKISSDITSTSLNATYVVKIKLGEKTIYVDEFKGNQTITPELNAPINGNHNLTINVYSKDLSNFLEKNLENNEKIIPLHIYSYGKYDFSSNTTNYSVISHEKIQSTKIIFENPVDINSIGTFVRLTAPLNVDADLIYEIVNDNEGVPGN